MTLPPILPDSAAAAPDLGASNHAPDTALDRRSFLRRAGLGAAAAAASAPALAALFTPSSARANAVVPGLSADGARALDIDALNFALNLEYLESEFYTFAVTGRGIDSFGLPVSGQGKSGTAAIKPNPAVPFQNPALYRFAAQISEDERMHVLFVRSAIEALGGTPVARPPLDLVNSFNSFAAAAGLGSNFDPFASEVNFLLGGYILSDVGVGANHGISGLFTNRAALSGAAGILATQGYHAGLLRSTLGKIALSTAPGVATDTNLISALRSKLAGGSVDYGVLDGNGQISAVLTDNSGLAISLTPRQVLNIQYGAVNASAGGFFPQGANSPLGAA